MPCAKVRNGGYGYTGEPRELKKEGGELKKIFKKKDFSRFCFVNSRQQFTVDSQKKT